MQPDLHKPQALYLTVSVLKNISHLLSDDDLIAWVNQIQADHLHLAMLNYDGYTLW
jgi:hypothetical protein